MPGVSQKEFSSAGHFPNVRWRRLWVNVAWGGVLLLTTIGMLSVRSSLSEAHIALVYLMAVLGGSSQGGRALGLALAITAFLFFNFFFIPPYHTLAIAEPLDWLILISFLVTAVVAAQLLAVAQRETDKARRRAAEVEHLSSLGAETLNAGRADDALVAIANVVRITLEASRCEVLLLNESGSTISVGAASGTEPAPPLEGARYGGASLLDWVAANRMPAVERNDGTVRVGHTPGVAGLGLETGRVRVLLAPLEVRERIVGVLRIAHAPALRLDQAQLRFFEALCYYAALGAERVRLIATSERAEALRQADVLKDALLASVSHDLRTPLTTIKALAHDIRSEGDERAVTIEEEADRLSGFVGDLLDLSQLAAGGLRLTVEINAVDDLMGAAIQRASGSVNGRTVLASIAPGDPLIVGRFDFVQSLRVLVNLLENAFKYSEPGSEVKMTARRVDGLLEFVVADRGAGVTPSERQRIFEPFYRSSDTAADAGGMGLGLSIAKQLAEAQGGSVTYEPREGGGSRFIFRLPAADISELYTPSPTSTDSKSL